MHNERVQQDLVPLFAALADRTRLRVLNLLKAGELCVCYFVELLGESQPKISRHLAYLRRAGVVSARRDGKWIHYSLAKPADPAVAGVLESTLNALERDKQMQRDRSLLERVCCGAKMPETLQNAPRPTLTV
jgi:ArsR family transcriptional regulator, arsenate/arsenite/antimonite-responsive transcriptional repressor